MSADSNKLPILVVDDEPEVRKLVSAMVTQFGYKVMTADSGEHALTVYRHHNGPIAMLITDVVAPGMSGPMLAQLVVTFGCLRYSSLQTLSAKVAKRAAYASISSFIDVTISSAPLCVK